MQNMMKMMKMISTKLQVSQTQKQKPKLSWKLRKTSARHKLHRHRHTGWLSLMKPQFVRFNKFKSIKDFMIWEPEPSGNCCCITVSLHINSLESVFNLTTVSTVKFSINYITSKEYFSMLGVRCSGWFHSVCAAHMKLQLVSLAWHSDWKQLAHLTRQIVLIIETFAVD